MITPKRIYSAAKRRFWKATLAPLKRSPFHLTRFTMYERLKAIGPTLPKRTGRVLSVSHSENLAGLLGIDATEIVSANYPEVHLSSLPFPDDSFDFVLSDQVLEHVEGNPQAAVDECLRVLRPGGIACHTTCFMNPVHGVPSDFWRFTPEALALLHKRFSRTLECAGWGNFEAVKMLQSGLRYEPIPLWTGHPLHRTATMNDPEWPIVTWIVAQK